MTKTRTYAVWMRGRRISTERQYQAQSRDEALWNAHYDFGCRTVDLDAVWLRPAKVADPKAFAVAFAIGNPDSRRAALAALGVTA